MSLQTYAGSDLNRISPTLQNYLNERKLKPGEMVKYRLLIGTKNIDPQRRKGDDVLFPAVKAIPLKTTIQDPENSNTVEIGVVKSFDDKTKQPVFKKFYVHPQKGDGGIFILRAGVVEEMEVYEALELSNYNKGNPYRDTTAEVIFERINDAAESKVRSTKRNYLFDSLDAIRHWEPNIMRQMGAAYNIPSTLEVDIIKDKLEEIAEKDPETFYDTIDSEDTRVRALIKLSTEAGIISFNAHENKWFYTGSDETLALLDRKEGVNEMTQFAEFLKNSANGPVIKGRLEKLLKTKKQAAVA